MKTLHKMSYKILCRKIAEMVESLSINEAAPVRREYERELSIVSLTNRGLVTPTPEARASLEMLAWGLRSNYPAAGAVWDDTPPR